MRSNNHGRRRQNRDDSGLIEKVLYVNRVAKVVKGGRRFSFSSIVVVGDGEGKVGLGHGKAKEVPEAIRKATERATHSMFRVPRIQRTIPHDVVGRYGAGTVLLRPASEGTGVTAGPIVRAIMQAAGIHNILTKSIGSGNAHNLAKAVISALKQLESAEQYSNRTGKPLEAVKEQYALREWAWGQEN